MANAMLDLDPDPYAGRETVDPYDDPDDAYFGVEPEDEAPSALVLPAAGVASSDTTWVVGATALQPETSKSEPKTTLTAVPDLPEPEVDELRLEENNEVIDVHFTWSGPGGASNIAWPTDGSLSDQAIEYLHTRGVWPAEAAQRGLHSIDDPSDLPSLTGLPGAAWTPDVKSWLDQPGNEALVFPWYGLGATGYGAPITNYQLRVFTEDGHGMDVETTEIDPKTKKPITRTLKFVFPHGADVQLDWLHYKQDATTVLFAEGLAKLESIRGELADDQDVSLIGAASCWSLVQGKGNPKNASSIVSQVDPETLKHLVNARRIIYVVDADALSNPSVNSAVLSAGTAWLQHGVEFWVSVAPTTVARKVGPVPIQLGAKAGVDDAIAANREAGVASRFILGDVLTSSITIEEFARRYDRSYDNSDRGRSERLASEARLHGLYFIPKERTWMAWNGRQYVKDTLGITVNDMAAEVGNRVFGASSDETKALRLIARSESAITKASKLARNQPGVVKTSEDFDPFKNSMLTPAPNGVLDFRMTGTDNVVNFRPPSKDDMSTRVIAAEYIPGATNEDWDALCKSAFSKPEVDADGNTTFVHDPTWERHCQMAFGLSLAARSFDYGIVARGAGRAGMSSVLGAIEAVLGEESYGTMSKDTFNANKANQFSTSTIAGKLMVTCTEMGQDVLLADSVWRSVTQNGEKMVVEAKYANATSVRVTALVVISGNDFPRIKSSGGEKANRERAVVIDFLNTIPAGERDPELLNRIKANGKSAVLNWLVEGLRMFLYDNKSSLKGEHDHPRSAALLEEWMTDNPVSRFMEERTVTFKKGDPEYGEVQTGKPELYRKFVWWCVNIAGIPKDRVMASHTFYQALTNGYPDIKSKHTNKGDVLTNVRQMGERPVVRVLAPPESDG